jgi:hypothetical protein
MRELATRYLQDDAKQEVKDADVIQVGLNLLADRDVSNSLQIIFKWKLQAFMRFSRYRTWPNGIPDDQLMEAIIAAQQVDAADLASVRDTLLKLDRIPLVGIPVASAFLTAMYPERFTIIDRQAYKALGAKFQDTVDEYLRYLPFCTSEASRLGVSLRDHDRALWQYGKDLGRKAQRKPSP